MEKKKIILDCDPGHDDAIAIMVAGLHEKLNLLGITVVAGNQTYENVTNNALKICNYLDINVPVYGGMKEPLIRKQIVASDFHGKTGLDGIKLPETEKKLSEGHGVNFIVDTLMESEGGITLVPVGPLTNIAMALKLVPEIKKKIEKIVLMGGSYTGGNATPYAEFNIYADPEAAHIVFSSGVPVYMMGLDITNKTMPDVDIVAKIQSFDTKTSDFLYQALHFPKRYDENGNFLYHTLHDVVTLAYLIDDTIVNFKRIDGKIELENKERYGETVCVNCYEDEANKEKIEEDSLGRDASFTYTVYSGTEIDLDKFWNIIYEVINK